jgi:hypothetical protein
MAESARTASGRATLRKITAELFAALVGVSSVGATAPG